MVDVATSISVFSFLSSHRSTLTTSVTQLLLDYYLFGTNHINAGGMAWPDLPSQQMQAHWPAVCCWWNASPRPIAGMPATSDRTKQNLS